MRLRGVVEISGELPAGLTRTLVRHAYRASRTRPVLLLLRETESSTVDALLDEAVDAMGVDYSGVEYGSREEWAVEELLSAAASADFVVVASADLRSELARAGVPHVGAIEGAAYLESLSSPGAGGRGKREVRRVPPRWRAQARVRGERAGDRDAARSRPATRR